MKPLIIIPDENQKTITMPIENFKELIAEVWEEGYKEGQEKRIISTFPNAKRPLFDESSKINSEDNNSFTKWVDSKRTFEEFDNLMNNKKQTNIW
jgi:hypothetical protein